MVVDESTINGGLVCNADDLLAVCLVCNRMVMGQYVLLYHLNTPLRSK